MVIGSGENMDVFACSHLKKVVVEMPDFSYKNSTEREGYHAESVAEDLATEQDLLLEQILKNINTTPIGQVLKKIASLPEVRRDKILNVRRQLTKGNYDLNERLNFALDRVLEELAT